MRNFVVFLVCSILKLATSEELTACGQSQKLFSDLCFAPTPTLNWDFKWFKANQPAEGWYSSIGNDIYQLHFSEVIKKEKLSPDQDFTDMCYRFHIDHRTGDGQLHAYGLSSNWTCRLSQDFPGVQMCDLQTDHTKYHMNSTSYISYHDKTTKFAVVIDCFQNGQIGWATISKHPKLTKEETKIAYAHVLGLGFNIDNVAVLHGDNCQKFKQYNKKHPQL